MGDQLLKSSQQASTLHPFAEVRRYIAFGASVIALLSIGLGAWAATVDLEGAVLATGNVVVDSNVKKVQHPTGGVIGAIHIREGQNVEASDLLISLDETVTRANLQMVVKQLDEIYVRQARLRAEHDNLEQIAYPASLTRRETDTVLAEIMRSETALFVSRQKARNGLRAQLYERISQLHEEIHGLAAQKSARSKELTFAQAELEGLEKLESKNLVSTPRITAARRSVAQLEGEIAQVTASTAQARGRISEVELQILQLDQDLKTEVGRELRDQQGREAELSERKIAAEDQLRRVEIRAPQSGTVHELTAHTVGGVIAPGEAVMLIVPQTDDLVIEAKVAPQDIDQVRIGQIGHVRFSAFNQRTTPEMKAAVSRISADLTDDRDMNGAAQSGEPYYSVRLILTEDGKSKLGNLTLIPGMPAEVHITTGKRTALTYFTKPVTDQFARAFRER